MSEWVTVFAWVSVLTFRFLGKEMNSMSKMILVFSCVGGSRRGRVALSGGSEWWLVVALSGGSRPMVVVRGGGKGLLSGGSWWLGCWYSDCSYSPLPSLSPSDMHSN